MKQSVLYAVFYSSHAIELGLERIERAPKCYEHQPHLQLDAPGHRSPHQESLWIETFLRGAFDMRRLRGVIQFKVVGSTAADDIVLLVARQGCKSIQIMLPLLNRDKT